MGPDGNPVGLRGLLKMSTDQWGDELLPPPSPGTAAASLPNKFFPTPSPLGASLVSRPMLPSSSTMSEATFDATASVVAAAAPGMTPSSSSTMIAGFANTAASLPLLPAPWNYSPTYGPPIRPLDFAQLDDDSVFDELQKRVEEFNGWLGSMQDGLDELCMASFGDSDRDVRDDGVEV